MHTNGTTIIQSSFHVLAEFTVSDSKKWKDCKLGKAMDYFVTKDERIISGLRFCELDSICFVRITTIPVRINSSELIDMRDSFVDVPKSNAFSSNTNDKISRTLTRCICRNEVFRKIEGAKRD